MVVMTNPDYPRVFISYAHEDKSLADELAKHLARNGVDPWFDAWEIGPGDSIVEKVFEEGLKDCAVFVIILSSSSVQSRWVRQELDVAVVNRIRKLTQVVPVLAGECEIPVSLRALRWLSLEKSGINEVVREIVDVAHKRKPEKPLIKPPPDRVRILLPPISGFSQEATTLGALIAGDLDMSQTSPSYYEGKAIQEALDFTPEQVNDAADELATRGLVRLQKSMGTQPFDFAWLEPTYALYYEFVQFLEDVFNPDEDIRQVAACVASREQVDGPTISQDLELPPTRVNFAVDYLADYGVVKVIRAFGTGAYSFAEVWATSATRRFVRQLSN